MAPDQKPADDTELLAAIRAGDHSAFATLVERHSTRYYRLAYRLLLHAQEAEDVVQDAFVHLWEKPSRYDANAGTLFTTWFYRVITNRCLDKLRGKKMFSLVSEEHSDGSTPQDVAMAHTEQQVHLEHAIAALPERQRVALTLSFYENLSNRDAAAIMNIKIGALESLLMRAKATLKEAMYEYR
ncbi:MAG: sigma-70 family RNA polymerase sigma factor [Rickettsiales bacterium]|nr:sigma-70 family RNA polymerase sigma factor [Rickettsiales bacterium]